MKLYYNPKLKEHARDLRKKATFAERLLWKYLRAAQLDGYHFLRQKPIDEYIVDFYCKRLKLVIEIDGVTHNDKQNYDKKREDRLKKLGLTILRIDGNYVIQNIEGTVETIKNCIKKIEINTSPQPPFKGGINST